MSVLLSSSFSVTDATDSNLTLCVGCEDGAVVIFDCRKR